MKKYPLLIKGLRTKLLLHQKKFALLLDRSRATIHSWETGRREPDYISKCRIIWLAEQNGILIKLDDFK